MKESMEESLEESRPASLSEMLGFYAPLAAMSILMMVTHSVISGAASRTLDPVLSLAAYSVAYSVGQIFETPCYSMQRMGLTFIKGRQSSATVFRVIVSLLMFILIAYSLVSWTPIAAWVFRSLLGVSDDIYPLAVVSLRVLTIWPVFTTIRSLFQPRIVLAKRTFWLTVNVLGRVGMMLAAAVLVPGLLPQGPVGAILLLVGVGTEGMLALLVTRKAIPPLEPDPPDEPPVTARQVFAFGLPICLATAAQSLGKPVLSAAMMRTLDPTLSLAGYQVATSFSFIFVALTYSIYHAVVVYVKDASSYRRIQAFCTGLGVLGFLAVSLCNLPPVGSWVFGAVIGAPPEVIREARRILRVLTLMPLTSALMEFYSGVLMMRQRASLVMFAKLANMLSTCTIAVGLATLFPGIGGAAGAAAITLGPLVEAGLCFSLVRRVPECCDLVERDVSTVTLGGSEG